MKILNDYDGSSIDVSKIDNSTNTAYLKLVTENGQASHYYNFIVENEKSQKGLVYIQNLNESMYYSQSSFAPFCKIDDKWKKLSKEDYQINANEIKFFISPNSKVELSLVPRYTKEDLISFCNKNDIKYEDSTLVKIELGNSNKPTIFVIGRQHPGETLSSFFIEGIIEKITHDISLQKNYHFVFFPIVNKSGVQNGNHRFANGVDFNRSWGLAQPPDELVYLKKQLEEIEKLEYFIDVHNDELTPNDYIRMSKPIQKEIAGIQVLETMGNLKRFIRALVKQRKIINLKLKTAREFVEKRYSCKSLLIELSMNDDFDTLHIKGEKFISSICKK